MFFRDEHCNGTGEDGGGLRQQLLFKRSLVKEAEGGIHDKRTADAENGRFFKARMMDQA